MKKLVLFAAVLGAVSLTSCSKCKDCTTYLLGAELATEELCGDDLEAVDKDENYDSTLQTGVKCE